MPTIDELLALAQSPNWSDRANAGRALVKHLGEPTADAALVRLIKDPEDTAPTFDTAVALLALDDSAGVRLLALALGDADEDTVNHSLDAMAGATQTQRECDALLARVHEAAEDPDATVRHGAATLLSWFDNP